MPAVLTPERQEKVAPAAPPRKRGIGHYLVESVIAVLAVILVVEVLFGMAGVGEQEYLRPDKVLGFVPMENKHVTWRKEGFGRIQFNSQGMNDIERPFAKPANTFRIAVIGDSFVESLQVDRSENFLTLLARDLNQKYPQGKHIEVINFGCSANNLGQFYKKINTKVFAYQPDVVMIGISVDACKLLAPLQGGFAFANSRPTFLLDKHGKLVEDWQVFNWWNNSPEGKRINKTYYLRRYSHIWGAIGTMIGSYQTWCQELADGKVWGWGAVNQPAAAPSAKVAESEKHAAEVIKANSDLNSCGNSIGMKPAAVSAENLAEAEKANTVLSSCGNSIATVGGAKKAEPAAAAPTSTAAHIALPQAQGDVDAATKQFWPVAEALITAMDKDCKEHNCRFAVAHLPARPDIGYDNPRETRNLEELTSREHIPYVDLTEQFVNAPKETSLVYSVHMTPAGHQLCYKILSDFFSRNHLAGN